MTDIVKSRIGLANIGNTCFLNVVLQALRLSPAIGELFLSNPTVMIEPRIESTRGRLLRAFQILIRDFWKHVPVGNSNRLIPHGFFHSLHNVLRSTENDWYRPGQQADAAEALQYILDSLHDAMYKAVVMDVVGHAHNKSEAKQLKALESWAQFHRKEYSPIIGHFYGQTQASITCKKCGNVSERYEPWLMIKAPIPGANVVGGPAPTLSTCLDAAFTSEDIDDYHCDTCKQKGAATMSTRISRLPPTLILSIKRFTNENHKVRGRIAWDLENTDFTPWMAFPRDPFGDNSALPVYESYAVIEHHGSSHGGHYRMYARQIDEWFEYDDSSVQPVTPDTVITADSYIVFMTLKRSVETQNKEFAGHIAAIRAHDAVVKAESAAPPA